MSDETPDGMSRRDAVKTLALAPLAGLLDWHDGVDKLTRMRLAEEQAARAGAVKAMQEYRLKFFPPHEMRTVRVLGDLVIPRDERSGSASDAKVPEFIDTLMADDSVSDKARRTAMHGGLAWLDRESDRRWGTTFVDAPAAHRTQLLDDIAWPAKAPAHLTQGVAFFSGFRDLVASGFWSSQMGVNDLQYVGNVFNPDWKGCPPAALKKLGLAAE